MGPLVGTQADLGQWSRTGVDDQARRPHCSACLIHRTFAADRRCREGGRVAQPSARL